jgi:hypothetical protein
MRAAPLSQQYFSIERRKHIPKSRDARRIVFQHQKGVGHSLIIKLDCGDAKTLAAHEKKIVALREPPRKGCRHTKS